jgi:hypothetical protein
MSKHETPMTQRFWEREGGTLLEEFRAVPAAPSVGQRVIDAVIVVGGERRIASRGESISLAGRDVIVVQTKAARLGMYLMGQALFSRELIETRFAPRSVRSVALCAADDDVLHPLADKYGIEVVVCQQ